MNLKAIFPSFFCYILAVNCSCLDNNYLGTWIDAEDGAIPTGSIVGGSEKYGTSLYICKVNSTGIQANGKVSYPLGSCAFPWNGQEKFDRKYKVLTNVTGVWAPVFYDVLPCNRLLIIPDLPTYAIRAFIMESLTVGTFYNSPLYTYAGKAYPVQGSYEMFTAVPRQLKISANKCSSYYSLNGEHLTFQVDSDSEVSLQFGGNSNMTYKITLDCNNKKGYIGTVSNPTVRIGQIICDFNKVNNWWVRILPRREFLSFGREGDMFSNVFYYDSGISKISSVKFCSTSQSTWNTADLKEA